VNKFLHGIVHGKTIELEEDSGLADGQEVEIEVTLIPTSVIHRSGEGLLRTEGALVDDEEWDAIMAEIYAARKLEGRLKVGDLEGA